MDLATTVPGNAKGNDICELYQRHLLLSPTAPHGPLPSAREHALFTTSNGFKNSSPSVARQRETSWYCAEVDSVWEENNQCACAETILQPVESSSCLNLLTFVGKKHSCQEMMGTERDDDAFLGDPHTRKLCEEGLKVRLLCDQNWV